MDASYFIDLLFYFDPWYIKRKGYFMDVSVPNNNIKKTIDVEGLLAS